jgi:hypothetical protein
LIAVAASGDWGSVLTDGWASAALRHRDVAWVDALLTSGFPREKPTPLGTDHRGMLYVLPVERREELLSRVLREDPSADIAVPLIDAADHQWSEKFAGVVLGLVRKRLTTQPAAGATWWLRERLPKFALRVPTSLASATQHWHGGEDAGDLADALDRFISKFTFRRELHEELER